MRIRRPPATSEPYDEPVAEHGRESRALYLPARGDHVVRHTVEMDDAGARIVDGVRRARIPVPRLPDRARIHEVALSGLEAQLEAGLAHGFDANAAWLQSEDRGNVAVAEKTQVDAFGQAVQLDEI